MDFEPEWVQRIEALEKRVAELEARPQPAQPIGGAGGNWPWPQPGPFGWKIDSNGTPYRVTTMPCGAVGSLINGETPAGMNGSDK